MKIPLKYPTVVSIIVPLISAFYSFWYLTLCSFWRTRLTSNSGAKYFPQCNSHHFIAHISHYYKHKKQYISLYHLLPTFLVDVYIFNISKKGRKWNKYMVLVCAYLEDSLRCHGSVLSSIIFNFKLRHNIQK